LSGNTATVNGGGIYNDGGTLALTNTIVTANSSGIGSDIYGAITSESRNLISISGDPMLAPLGDYGGPTQTRPPLYGSPAIDAGTTTPLTTDQRGFARVVGSAVDIGAVETGNAVPGVNYTVVTNLPSLNIVKMATDYTLPYIYLLHTANDTNKESSLLWYNTDLNIIEKVLPAGTNATDLTVHYGNNRIYVSNWQYAETRVFDRTSKTELAPLLLGTDVYKINAGRAGRIYTETRYWFAYISGYDATDGSQIFKSGIVNEGDGECSLNGQFYYHSDSGSTGSKLHKYNVTADTLQEVASKKTKLTFGSRNIFLSMDGSRVYNCGTIYDADLEELRYIGSEVYAASAYGDMVLTSTKVFSGETGDEIYTLPFSSTVMAFSGDQSELLLFNASSGAIASLMIPAIMPIPEPVMTPNPADGSVVGANLPELSWSEVPGGPSYDVYLGTDSNAVANAGTNDVQYLGRRTTTDFSLTDGMLTGNQTYYWRMDIVASGNMVDGGDVWHFQTASIAVDPCELTIAGMAAAYTQTVSFAVNSTVEAPVTWTASCTTDWVLLGATSGTASGTLDIGFDMSGLVAGTYTAEIIFNDGSIDLPVPVTLEVEAMNIVKMATDWTLPYIYMVHTSSTAPNKSRLIWYNTDTDCIEQVLDAGKKATDIAVHYTDNQIYVSAMGVSEVAAFDRLSKTREEDLVLHEHVYRIGAGPSGLVVSEDDGMSNGYYARMHLWDNQTGASLQTTAQYTTGRGTGESDTTGRYYYHADGTVYPYTGTLRKYDMTSGTLVQEASIDAPKSSRRELIISGDGSHLFWKGSVYDSDLNLLSNLGQEIYAASVHGELALTQTNVLNGVSGASIYALPFSTDAMAFSGDQSKLLLFDPTAYSLVSIALTNIVSEPLPDMIPSPANDSIETISLPEISWSGAPLSFAYDVYFGTDSNAVTSADTNSAVYFGRQAETQFVLPDGLLSGGETYYWRVDPIGYEDSVVHGDVWCFHTPSIVVTPREMEIPVILAAYTQTVSVAIDSSIGGPAPWTATSSTNWLTLAQTSGTAPSTLNVYIDAAQLDEGPHSASIQFSDGARTFTMPVTVDAQKMRIVKMATDWTMPYIYMIHTFSTAPNTSMLIWYNTDTDSIEQVLDAGENATDLTVSYADNRIYVNNWQRAETRVFDRTSKTELAPLLLGTDVYAINAGRAGRVHTEGEDQWVRLSIRDTSTGSEAAYKSVREGDGDCTLDGRFYYHCDNNSSGASIQKYDVTADTYTQVAGKRTAYYYGSRNIFLSMDGNRVYNCGYIYDSDLNELLNIGSEIYAASLYGDMVLTATKACNGVSGKEVYTLPFSSTVMAFSGDQSSLVLFNAANGTLTNLNTADIMPVPEPTTTPNPANGAVVGANLPELSWSGAPSAIAYDVYLGTDSNAVASAGTNGVQYLGRRITTDFSLTDGMLTGNQTYFWRVDVVAFGNTVVDGDVWNFQTASIAVDPCELTVAGVVAGYTQTVSVAVNSTAGIPVEWTASCTNDWVLLGATSGTASGTLDIGFDMSELAAGTYTANIVFDDGSVELILPVSLEVVTMRIVKMATDWSLPYIYMIHTSSTAPNTSLLIWYNTDTDSIEQALDAGENATDLTVSYADNRIYVSNWQHAETRVFDRTSKTELDPLLLGSDVYKINAGRAGRVITEEKDQWITVCMRDTSSGTVVVSGSEREGDGDCTLDGRFYYRCDNNISDARLYKYAVTNDAFESVTSTRTKSYYGSRNVFVSMDGNRVYNCGYIYDSDLNELLNIGSEIYAASSYGDMVLTATKAYNGVSGASIYTLPFSTSVMAFSGNQSSLVLFNAANGTLTNLNTADIMPIPEPTPFIKGSVTLSNTNRVYNGTPHTVTAMTDPANLAIEITYNGSTNAPVDAGSYTVIGTLIDDLYYGSVTGTLTVAKADQTVTFPAIETQEATSTVQLAATASSGLEVTFSVVSGPASISDGTNLTFSGAGSVSVAACQAGDTNWNPACATNTFEVIKVDQTVHFPAIGMQEVTNRVQLTATASSGLEVTFSVVSGPASISGGTALTFSGAGSVSIAARQAGNTIWNPAGTTNTFDVVGIITNVSPVIGSELGGTAVAISGLWLGSGTNITNVTLCGVSANVISQDVHFVTVLSGATNITTNLTGNVEVASDFGKILLTNAFTYCPVPEAPVACSAVNITSNQFTARWMAADNTTHYYLDVSESTNFTATTGIYSNWSAGNATAGLVTGLTDGVTCWYRVRAANEFGSSENSNLIEVPVSTNTPYVAWEIIDGVASSGSSDVLDLTKLFHGSGMIYEVVSNSNPSLVTATIIGTELVLEYADDVTGTASITVRVTDPDTGFGVENTITVSVVSPPVVTRGTVTLNTQNGLFEQVISVNNVSALSANSVTLTASNLTAGAKLYNATGMDLAGNPEIHWIGTLAAGASMDFVLQYYSALRGVVPGADVIVSLSLEDLPDEVTGSPFGLSGEYRNLDGSSSFLIEFEAVPGKTYHIQYTDSLSNPWKTVQPGIVAPANRIQWIDSGPPGTECAPGDAGQRFYRIIEAN
jgi:hypothetical protein